MIAKLKAFTGWALKSSLVFCGGAVAAATILNWLSPPRPTTESREVEEDFFAVMGCIAVGCLSCGVYWTQKLRKHRRKPALIPTLEVESGAQ